MKESLHKVYAGPANVEVLSCVPIGERVLDIGCGAGVNAASLKQHGHKVWGITLSADEAKIAADYCEDVQICNVETGTLPYDEHFFDVILMSHDLGTISNRLSPLARRRDLLAANANIWQRLKKDGLRKWPSASNVSLASLS